MVLARRRSRHLNPLRRLLFGGFYKLFELLADYPVPLQAGIYCLLGRRAWKQIAGLREANRFLPGLRAWVGFPTTTVSYDRGPRGGGAQADVLGCSATPDASLGSVQATRLPAFGARC